MGPSQRDPGVVLTTDDVPVEGEAAPAPPPSLFDHAARAAARAERLGDAAKAVLRYEVTRCEEDETGALRLRVTLYDLGERGETEEDGWTVDAACADDHEHTSACVDAALASSRPVLDALRAEAVARRPGAKARQPRDRSDLIAPRQPRDAAGQPIPIPLAPPSAPAATTERTRDSP